MNDGHEETNAWILKNRTPHQKQQLQQIRCHKSETTDVANAAKAEQGWPTNMAHKTCTELNHQQ